MIVVSIFYILYELAKEKFKPVPPPRLISEVVKINDIVDSDGYDYDVEHYGKDFAESMRMTGRYMMKRRNIYG